jgi:hypothetical protein
VSRDLHISAAWYIGTALLVCCLTGCGFGNAKPPAPPDPAAARTALESALEAWKNGQTPEELRQGDAAIHMADEQWHFGGKLHEFSILEEEKPQGTQVRFRVQLQVSGQGRTSPTKSDVNYLVLGGTTLSIIRDDS